MLEPRNRLSGFFGTCLQHMPHPMAEAAWDAAFRAIHAATLAEGDAVRAFLDGDHGRHFADGIVFRVWSGQSPEAARMVDAAIGLEVTRWMGWSIDLQTARRFGIRYGQPYLTGWVAHYGLTAEADAGAGAA